MKQRLLDVKQWIKSHRRASLVIAGAVLILIAVATSALAWQLTKPEKKHIPDIKIAKRPPKPVYSPLTGIQVKDQAVAEQAVTAIMIENSPDARPHSGLQQAGVVYEAIAEGGITRYLALYQESKPALIGPVRSLRLYFVDWLAPYQASVAHVGGSAEALRQVRNGKYRDIDQFFNANSYWRANDRYAPHNVYTSFDRLDKLNKQKNFLTSKFESFARVDAKPSDKPDATNIKIDFSSALYNTSYRYNAKDNNYTRHLAGQPHKDREKGNITPSVIVAIRVNESTVMQDGAREKIDTTGNGKATVFQNGTAIEATWRKQSVESPLELLDANGKPIELVRGQTWIAAVPNNRGGVSW